VNYLRACPLPEAAAAVVELEKIDPEAVRRAATLAGIAGLVASGSAATEVDPDDNSGRDQPLPATAAGAEPVATITVAPVLADAEATDAEPGHDPAATPARAAAPAAASRGWWKWIVWGAVVTAIALASRAAMRPTSPGNR
jgi:hypothetical protein